MKVHPFTKVQWLFVSIILMASLMACGVSPEESQPSPETQSEAQPTATITPTAETPPETSTARQATGAETDLPTPLPPTPTLDSNIPTPTPEAYIIRPESTVDPSLLAPLPTTPQQISLTTADGITLAGVFYPTGEAKSPALLLLHMLGSDNQAWRNFALQAQGEGYAVLAFDLRGHGRSEGERDTAAMDQDVNAALDWLQNSEAAGDTVDPDRIAILGASIGANLALRAGANHPEVKAVALLSPGLDYSGITTRQAKTDYGDRPTLIIAAEGDNASVDSAKTLAEIAPAQTTLNLYEGNAHGTNFFGTQLNISQVLLTWLADNL